MKNQKSRLLTFSIICLPFFRQYSSFISGISLADIMLMFSIVYGLLIKEQTKILINETKPLFIFWLYGFIISLITLNLQLGGMGLVSITRLIRYSFYVFTVMYSVGRFDLDYGIHIYKKLIVVVSAYLFLQVVTFETMNIILPFKILPFRWMGDSQYNTDLVAEFASKYYYRPSSIFIEPGYIPQFILPGLALSLYGWKYKYSNTHTIDWKYFLTILLTLILSTSTQSIMIGFIVIAIYYFTEVVMNKSKIKRLRTIIFIVPIIVIVILTMQTDFYLIAMDKVQSISKPGSSGAVRIMRGFAVYDFLNPVNKLFGIGHGNIGNFVVNHSIVTRYDPLIFSAAFSEYASGTSSVLLYYGAIGFMIHCVVFFKIIKNSRAAIRLISISFLLLTLVSTVYFDVLIVFYFSLIYNAIIVGKDTSVYESKN